MPTNPPKVSVVVPVYNGEKYLDAAIRSILCQSFRDLEVVAVDDGSTDRSAARLRAYSAIDKRVRVLSHSTNRGIVAAQNTCLHVARGRYIAKLDQDDIACPDRLSRQVAFLEANPQIGVVGSAVVKISTDGRKLRTAVKPETHDQICFGMLFNNCISDPSVMFRASSIVKAKLKYEEEFTAAEDYAFFVSLLRASRGHNLREALTFYRIHEEQMSQVSAATQQGIAERISAGLIRDLGFGQIPTWHERSLIMALYEYYLSMHRRGKRGDTSQREEIHHVVSTSAEQAGYGPEAVKQHRYRLSEMLSHFLAATASRDAGLMAVLQLASDVVPGSQRERSV